MITNTESYGFLPKKLDLSGHHSVLLAISLLKRKRIYHKYGASIRISKCDVLIHNMMKGKDDKMILSA